MVKHLQRLNQLSLGLALVALSATVGGCALLGGGDTSDQNVKPSPQASSQAFPSPTLPTATAAGTKVALTRPTNPDERVKAIKSGRNDPFAAVVAPASENKQGGNWSSPTGSPSPDEQLKKLSDVFGNIFGMARQRPSQPGYRNSPRPGQSSIPTAGSSSGSFSGLESPGGLVEAPKPPEPMNVQVMGIASVGGVPQAIVQAPGEPTSRTVGVGDSLAGGSLIVKSIDTSNPADPVVVFQQGSIAFSVGVGREPSMVASR